jgi:hypothetical protein
MKGLLVAVMLVFATPAFPDEPIIKPIRWTWVASSCSTWNCAAAAMVMADGDSNTMIMPTGRSEQPWIILRRVEQGSVFIPEEEPYGCSVFETIREAATHYDTMETCFAPMLLNVPDGRAVIASLRNCPAPTKQRAVR